jgi:DNA-binding Xre family transcriptional regulator
MAVLRLGAMLRDRRGRLGIREGAKQIGISPATLVRVEAGRMPDLETFQKICIWLKVNPADILDIPVSDSPSADNPEKSLPMAAVHLRADKTLPPGAANDLATLIVIAQQELVRRSRQRRTNVPARF